MTWHKCSFVPSGVYFFGGEKIFDFEGSNNYYIVSQRYPSQSTILGALRFLVLKNKEKLSPEKGSADETLRKEQEDLIGRRGDVMEVSSYGKIEKVSPVFLSNENEILIRTPFNHKYGEKEYTPFTMKDGYMSEKGQTILPVDFVAKDGLTDSYLNLSDNSTIESDEIFGFQEQTHIARKRDDAGKLVMDKKAFFKKKYCLLKSSKFAFTCFVNCEKDLLPESEVVFLGQEKSIFYFTSNECQENEFADIEAKIRELYKTESGYSTYYVESDTYFKDSEKLNESLAYSIVNKKAYRFITDQRNGRNYKERILKSKCLYQFIEAGSVLFVGKDKKEAFEKMLDENAALRKSGFNYIVEFKKGE